MKLSSLFRRTALAAGLMFATLVVGSIAQAQSWGDLSGQFVLDGNIPAIEKFKNEKEKLCMAEIASDELLVNKENKGIADVYVYIPTTKKPDKIHPDLKASKEKQVVLDQEGCRFIPHALVMRTDQTLSVKSKDDFNHNTRTNPIKNNPMNVIVGPKDRKGLEATFKLAENLPTQVKCDIHPWMSAYCLIIDHPYATVTDKDGKFKIENLPTGELEFRYWHSQPGYIERAIKITIKPGSNDVGVIKVPVAKFEEKK